MLMKTDAKYLAPLDLSQPSLLGLVYLLQHKELWPPNFHWDYWQCDKCAMGLATAIWGTKHSTGALSAVFGIEPSVARRLFLGYTDAEMHTDPNMSPKTIANRISRYLGKSGS